jgi:phage terminase large subunit
MIGFNQVAAHLLKWADTGHKERFLMYQGGTYAGKTMGTMLALYALCKKREQERAAWELQQSAGIYKGEKPKFLEIRVVGINLDHLKAGAMGDLKKVLAYCDPEVLATANKTERKFSFGESYIKFYAMDKAEKGLGLKTDYTFINEGNKMPYDRILELDTRTEYGIIVDWNPTGKFWAHQQEYILTEEKADGRKHTRSLRKDVRFVQWNYSNNAPFVSPRKIAQIKGWEKTAPNKYSVYGLGFMGELEGVVFANVVTAKYFPSDCDFELYGLDWGGLVKTKNDPTAVVRLGLRVGDRSLYCEEVYYGWDSPQKLAKILYNRLPNNARIVCETANPASNQTLQNELKEYANQNGTAYIKLEDAVKGTGSVEGGLVRLRTFKNIVLTESSTHWREEAQTYVYVTKANGSNAPKDKDNHLWDAARYASTSEIFTKAQKALRRAERDL